LDKNIQCPVCHAEITEQRHLPINDAITSDLRYVDHKVINRFCDNCGYIFVDKSVYLNLEEHYKEDYNKNISQHSSEPVIMEENQIISHSAKRVELFSKYFEKESNRKFFDIGAGKGSFIEEMYKRYPNYIYYALEPGVAFNILEKKAFLRNYYNDFFCADNFGNEQFDFISIIEVLEHVSEPKFFLLEICEIMNEQSLLLIEIPNFQVNMTDLIVIDHLSKFTPESIKNLFKVSGLAVVFENIPETSVPMQFIVKKANTSEIEQCEGKKYIDNSLNYIKKSISEAQYLQNHNIAVYGQSPILSYLYDAGYFSKNNLKIIIDDNIYFNNKRFKREIPIVSFDQFLSFNKRGEIDKIFLAMSRCYHSQVLKKLNGFEVFGR